jgi:hypothetical protein
MTTTQKFTWNHSGRHGSYGRMARVQVTKARKGAGCLVGRGYWGLAAACANDSWTRDSTRDSNCGLHTGKALHVTAHPQGGFSCSGPLSDSRVGHMCTAEHDLHWRLSLNHAEQQGTSEVPGVHFSKAALFMALFRRRSIRHSSASLCARLGAYPMPRNKGEARTSLDWYDVMIIVTMAEAFFSFGPINATRRNNLYIMAMVPTTPQPRNPSIPTQQQLPSGSNRSRKPVYILRRSEPLPSPAGAWPCKPAPRGLGQMAVAVGEPDPTRDFCFPVGDG